MIQKFDRKALERSVVARLVAGGKLDDSALDRVRRLQGTSDDRLEALLVKLGLAGERDVGQAMAQDLEIRIAELSEYPPAPVLESRLSKKFLRHSGALPLHDGGDILTVAMIDPLNEFAAEAIAMASGRRVAVRLALPTDFEAAFVRLYEPDGATPASESRAANDTNADEDLSEDVDRLRDLASEAPVVRLVNQLITRAVESRASDIHVEPLQNRLVVRYRIDGVLREVASPPSRLRALIISRIKIMAKLNIAERRLPQDGRLRLAAQGREYDLRVATAPSLHGEAVVMRILDRASLAHDFGTLGFQPETLGPYGRTLDHPQGILLVTGPTGSGKTTTLYASLARLNVPERKLFTVEDPIEYQLEGITQIQIKPQIGLTFANILRSILRQDPDVIMVGEMRDLETAQIAVQAALTGHLVLSTLHTNSAAGTITRLLDMGVEDYLVASTVNGVLAQRLVRKLCVHCREPYRAMPELVAQLRLPAADGETTLYRPRGCEQCQGSGYLGRIAILEFLGLSEEIRRLVLRRAPEQEVHRAAAEAGMQSMYEDGMRKVVQGLTSVEDVLRVTRDFG